MRKHSIGALILLSLLIAACGKDKDPGQTPPEAVTTTITDLSTILGTADKRTLVGRKVDISRAQVGRITGFYIFWAGDPHSAVPIARYDKLNAPGTTHPVHEGQHASIAGTIRLPDNVDPNDPIWKTINATEKRDITEAQIYIAADRVTPLP